MSERPDFELERSGKLLIWVLSVRSSYGDNVEVPAGSEPFDTLQWWIGPTVAWRVRTYALDHDLHAHALVPVPAAIEDLAVSNTDKTYGDVILRHFRLEIGDVTDSDAVERAFAPTGLTARIEARGPFAFWPPDVEAPYRTKSTPEGLRN